MADFKLSEAFNRLRTETAWRVSLLVWLLIVTMSSSTFVAMALSSYQLRIRLQSLVIDKNPISLTLLKSIDDQISKEELTTGGAAPSSPPGSVNGSNYSDYSAPTFNQTSIDYYWEQKVSLQRELSRQLRETEFKIRTISDKLGRPNESTDLQATQADGTSKDLSATENSGSFSKSNASVRALLKGLWESENREEALLDIRRRIDELKGRAGKSSADNIRSEIDKLEQMYVSAQSTFDDSKYAATMIREVSLKLQDDDARRRTYIGERVLGNKDAAEADKLRAAEVLDEFRAIRRMFSPISNILFIPHELLTIFLVAAAGAFGRAVGMLNSLRMPVDKTSEDATFLAPLFGAAVSLVLFVVIKAGVIIAIDPRGVGQAGAELSPFFIAFIGIAAGLLSSQVVDRIQVLAADLLRSQRNQVDRWIINSKTEKDPSRLKALIPEIAADLDEWLAGTKPVPERYQSRIADWLEAEPRQIFTDIAP